MGSGVSLGSFGFTRHGDHAITLGTTNGGVVAADAVMLVRDTTGEVDAEAKDITYAYDANGNMVGISDDSSGARVEAYEIDYTGLNQVQRVRELADGDVTNTTAFSYDDNGNPLTTTHDDTYAAYAYDVRDLVEQVTNADTPADPDPKLTGYTYTPNGRIATEVKPNQNTVTYDYYLDGLLKHQLESKADGSVVAEHALSYDPNGNRITDVSQVADADTAAVRDRTYAYTYDPRDRVTGVVKTDTSTGASLSTESYVHDAVSNVISQTIDGTTTSYAYDRNRLLTATTGGVTAAYNYDAFGRLDTVTAAGQVIESYAYDGFDRITEHTSLDEAGGEETTSYAYDPLDRTASRTDTDGETTDYSYLGLSGDVLSEEVAGEIQKSYQYSPWGKRLSQIKHDDTGDSGDEVGFYGYNPHTDVETLTDHDGDPVTTYGYTAYGNDDTDEFTGADSPDAGTPGGEPYNVYRYNAKRWDAASGTYDMGFRDYAPGLNRFLSRDMYNGALADLNLTTSMWNSNRYAFAGGNPINRIELDGHAHVAIDGGGISDGGWENPTTGEIHTPEDPTYSSLPAVGRPQGSATTDTADSNQGLNHARGGAFDNSGATVFESPPGERLLIDCGQGCGEVLGEPIFFGPGSISRAPLVLRGAAGGVKNGWNHLTNGISSGWSKLSGRGGAPQIKAGSEGGTTAGKAFSQRVRQEALQENPNVCVYCRMKTDRPQVDHVIPRSRGGNATSENAQTTCWWCNASKGARDFPVNPPPGYEGMWPPSWWGLLP